MRRPVSAYLPAENGRLYYEMAGEGAPLVFLHGFTLDQRMSDASGIIALPDDSGMPYWCW